MPDKLTNSDSDSVNFSGHNLKNNTKNTLKNIGGFTLSFVLVLSQIFLGSTIYVSEQHASASTIPSPPTGVTATSDNGTSITMPTINLAWNASPGATSYTVYRSTNSTGPFNLLNSTSTTSYTDTGSLTYALTTYYYEITATNSTGTSALSTPPAHATSKAVACMDGMAMPGCIPLAPTSLTATKYNSSAISLTWTDSIGPAKHPPSLCTTCIYTIYRSTSSSGPFTTSVGTSPPSPFTGNSIRFLDNGLAASSTYYYEITATWAPPPPAGLTSPLSSTTTATTYSTTPGIPTGLTVTSVSSTQVGLSWNAVSGAGSYGVYHSTSPSGPFTLDSGQSVTGTTFSDIYANATFTNYFYVTSVSTSSLPAGSQSGPSSLVKATLPISAPTGVSATALSSSSIKLSWTAINATSYTIYRSTSSGGTYTIVGTPTSSTFTDTGIPPGTTYYYKLTATNSGGTSGFSSIVNTTTPPTTPTGVSATTLSSSSIKVSWTASTGAAGYTVYHSTSSTGPFTALTNVGSSPFSDTGLTAGTTHYFEIAAFPSAGTTYSSPLSTPPAFNTTVSSAPTAVTATALSSSSISVSWTASSGATSYTVYRSTSSSGPFTTSVGTPTSSPFTDTGLTPSTTYYYKLTATNSGGTSALSSTTGSATTLAGSPPSAPTAVTATALSSSSISVSWTASSGATSYTVYRSTSSSGPFTTSVGTPTSSPFNDTGLTPSTTYYYEMTATNAYGTSGLSTPPASATTLTITGTCGLNLGTSTINYGTTNPGSTPVPALNPLLINNTGTVNAVLTVTGGNWTGSQGDDILASNTQFNNHTAAGPFTPLALHNGLVTVTPRLVPNPAPHTSSLTTYWQLIPQILNLGYTGALTQTLTFSASC